MSGMHLRHRWAFQRIQGYYRYVLLGGHVTRVIQKCEACGKRRVASFNGIWHEKDFRS